MSNDLELTRVKLKIGDLVMEFYRERMLIKKFEFHMNDLSTFINGQIPNTTLDSASRILRNMRQKGQLNYRVVSRRDSHYELIPAVPVQTNMF